MNTRRASGFHWLWLSTVALANISFAGTAEETVKAYLEALPEDAAKATVEYIHPAELARFRDMLLPVFVSGARAEGEARLAMLFGKGATVAKLETMSPAEFTTAIMTAVGEQIKGVKFTAVEVLGAVPENELMHVVTRITVEGPNSVRMTRMEVVTAKRHEDGWKLALTGQLEGLAEAFKAR